jgi:hypothetical protein
VPSRGRLDLLGTTAMEPTKEFESDEMCSSSAISIDATDEMRRCAGVLKIDQWNVEPKKMLRRD